jgi:condensation domain-containing protein
VQPQPRPVTHSQASLFFAEVGGAQPGAYNVVVEVDVTGPLRDDTIVAACRELVAATPALRLRMGVAPRTGEIVSFFPNDDLAVEPAFGDEADVTSFCDRPFDVDEGSLARFLITSPAPSTRTVRLVMHHVVSDGVSQVALTERLADLLTGHPIQPQGEREYTDLVEFVRQAETAARDVDRAHWERRLSEVCLAATPIPHAPGVRQAARRVLSTSSDVMAAVADVARGTGDSVFRLMVATLHTALPRSAAATAIGVAATQRPAGARTCGSFINEVPLIAAASVDDTDPVAVLRASSNRWREDLRRRHYPLVDLAGWLAGRGADGLALTRVMASYRTDPALLTRSGAGRVARGHLMFASPAAKTDVAARFFHGPDGMRTEVQWSGVPADGAGERVATMLAARLEALASAGVAA